MPYNISPLFLQYIFDYLLTDELQTWSNRYLFPNLAKNYDNTSDRTWDGLENFNVNGCKKESYKC